MAKSIGSALGSGFAGITKSLDEIGEQRLDIVSFARGAEHPFKEVALSTAAKL